MPTSAARSFVLDDSEGLNVPPRKDLFTTLRTIGVNVRRLIWQLWKEPDRGLLIRERRAKIHEIEATVGRRFANKVAEEFARHEVRLRKQDREVPEAVYDAVFALLGALDVPVNYLTDRLEGDPPEKVWGSQDRTPARFAAERRALDVRTSVHKRIAPGAATGALQQRYMQDVRRRVHAEILECLLAYEGRPLRYAGRKITNQMDSEIGARPSADVLTAAFIQTMYPSWGATTTPDVVRKGLAKRRGRAR